MAGDLGKSSTGLQPNVAALVAYLGGWITGLIFFVIEKDNKFIRFHALQSIIVFGALSVAAFVMSILLSFVLTSVVSGLIGNLLWLVSIVLWVILMVKAYQGEYFKLPIAGDIAEKNC